MGVYANGHLIYGFVHDGDTKELFNAVTGGLTFEEFEKLEELEEGSAFEELHTEFQTKHHVSLYQVGYARVAIISAYSANASAKGLDMQPIKAEDLVKTEEYAKNIAAFLTDIGIDPGGSSPGWYILGYMD